MALTGTPRVKTSTINDYLKQIEAPIYRTSVLMGMLKSRGLIKNNCGGDNVVWNVRYLRRTTRKITGAVTSTTFPNTSTEIPVMLPWSGRDMGESIAKLERLKNQGSQTKIYDLVKNTLGQLNEDFQEDLRLRLWQDGTITGDDLMGHLSIYGGSSTPRRNGIYSNPGTYTASTGTDGSSYWWCCTPNNSTTYASVSTALGTKVNDFTIGDTTQNFPEGDFSEGYNFYSPLYIDYNSKAFTPNPGLYSGTSVTPVHCWESQWQQACNAAVSQLKKLQGSTVDMIILSTYLMQQAKDSLIGQQRFIVSDSSETRALGFPSLNYNGVEFMDEYGVPDGMGFCINFSKMEWRNMQGQLIERTEDSDIVTSEDLYKLDHYSQLLHKSPAHFACLVPATASGT